MSDQTKLGRPTNTERINTNREAVTANEATLFVHGKDINMLREETRMLREKIKMLREECGNTIHDIKSRLQGTDAIVAGLEVRIDESEKKINKLQTCCSKTDAAVMVNDMKSGSLLKLEEKVNEAILRMKEKTFATRNELEDCQRSVKSVSDISANQYNSSYKAYTRLESTVQTQNYLNCALIVSNIGLLLYLIFS